MYVWEVKLWVENVKFFGDWNKWGGWGGKYNVIVICVSFGFEKWVNL